MSAKRPRITAKRSDKFAGGRYLKALKAITISIGEEKVRPISPSELGILRSIGSCVDVNNFYAWRYMRLEDIEDDTHYSQSTIKLNIATLKANGYLDSRSRRYKGKAAPTDYRLTPKAFEAYAKLAASRADENDLQEPVVGSCEGLQEPVIDSCKTFQEPVIGRCELQEPIEGPTGADLPPSQEPVVGYKIPHEDPHMKIPVYIDTQPPVLPSADQPARPKVNLRSVLPPAPAYQVTPKRLANLCGLVNRVMRPRSSDGTEAYFPTAEWKDQVGRTALFYPNEDFERLEAFMMEAGENNKGGRVAADLEKWLKVAKGELTISAMTGGSMSGQSSYVPHAQAVAAKKQRQAAEASHAPRDREAEDPSWVQSLEQVDVEFRLLEHRVGHIAFKPATLDALYRRYELLSGKAFP